MAPHLFSDTCLHVHGETVAQLERIIKQERYPDSRTVLPSILQILQEGNVPSPYPAWIVLEDPESVPERILHLTSPVFYVETEDEDKFYSSDPERPLLILNEQGNGVRYTGTLEEDGYKEIRIHDSDIPNIDGYDNGLIHTGFLWFDPPPGTIKNYLDLMSEARRAFTNSLAPHPREQETAATKTTAAVPLGRIGEMLILLRKYSIFRGKHEKTVTALLEEAMQRTDAAPLLEYVLDIYRTRSQEPKFNTVPIMGEFIASFWKNGAGEQIKALIRENPNNQTIYLLNEFIVELPREEKALRKQYYTLLIDCAQSTEIPETVRRQAEVHVQTIAEFTPVE